MSVRKCQSAMPLEVWLPHQTFFQQIPDLQNKITEESRTQQKVIVDVYITLLQPKIQSWQSTCLWHQQVNIRWVIYAMYKVEVHMRSLNLQSLNTLHPNIHYVRSGCCTVAKLMCNRSIFKISDPCGIVMTNLSSSDQWLHCSQYCLHRSYTNRH